MGNMQFKRVIYSISPIFSLSFVFRFAFISCYVQEKSNIRLLRERNRRYGPSPQSEIQRKASINNASRWRRRRRKRVVVHQQNIPSGEDAKVRRHKRSVNGNEFVIESKATSISPTISKTSSSELLSEIQQTASNNNPSRWRRPRRKRIVDNQLTAASAEDAKVRRHERNANGNEFSIQPRENSLTPSPTIVNTSIPTIFGSSGSASDDASVDQAEDIQEGTSTLSPTMMNLSMPTKLESSPSPTILSTSSGTSTLLPTIMNSSSVSASDDASVDEAEDVQEGTSTFSPTIMNSSTPTNLESSGSASNDESIVAEEDIMSSLMPTNLESSGSTSNDENADGSADEVTLTLSPTVVNSSIPTNLESSHSPSAILTILNTTDSPTPSTYTISGSFSGSFTSTYLPTNQ